MSEQPERLPSLNALRVFEVVARHLNFRRAAEELGVTQGAVAQQIRGLEADLEIRLFERLARSLALTDAGRGYQASIRRAFELIAEATRALRPEPLHLTISVTPTFASKWLIPRLHDFTGAYPQIDLRVLATERLSSFHNDAVDLAVRYGQPPFGPGLETRLLFEQRIVAVLHEVLRESPMTLSDLAREGFTLKILAAVQALSPRGGESEEEFVVRVGSDPLARVVKLADLADESDLTRIVIPGPADIAHLQRCQQASAYLQALT